jgi:O-antigen/teichoic acid export membrane protein
VAESRAGGRAVRTARSIVVLTACEALSKVGTLITIVGAARVLPIAEFGVFAVAIGAGTLIAVVPSWGFDTLVVQRGAASPAALPGLLANLLAVRLVVLAAVLAVAGGVTAATGRLGDDLFPVGLIVVACLVETLGDAYRSVAIALESPWTVAVAQLLQRGFAAALVLAVLILRPSLGWLSIVYLAGAVAGVVAMASGTARLGVRPRWTDVTRPGAVELCRASSSGGLHTVASMALFRVDAVMLALLAGAAAAGRYAAAYRLLETVIFVAWTVARSVFPVMASSADAAGIRRGAERGLVVLATVFLPYAAVLFSRGGDVLRLLYGDSFEGGSAMLGWLAPAPLLFGAAYLAAYVLMADGPNPRVLLGSFGALILNIALNGVLIPRFGPVGAAAATTLSYGVETLLLYPAARRRAGRPALLLPLLPAAGASAASAVILLLPLPFFAALTLAAPMYVLVWLALVIRVDPEQVQVVRGLWITRLPERTGL